MAYGYAVSDPHKVFRSWVQYQSELIDIAVGEGYTRQEAIEILKVWKLYGIEDNTGMITGNNY